VECLDINILLAVGDGAPLALLWLLFLINILLSVGSGAFLVFFL
jgi:hypothetical protein